MLNQLPKVHFTWVVLATLLVGCPSTVPEPPIPSDDDDDDDSPECLDPVDVTASLDAENLLGSTEQSEDDFFGTCSNGSQPDDLLVFTAPATANYALSTDHPGTNLDTVVFVFTDCPSSEDSELGCNDDSSPELASSALQFDAMEGQDIYIVVEGYDLTGNYELSIETVVCGDGILAPTEGCDDGNITDGDGCNAQCQWECDGEDEYEDDDSLAEATPLDGSTSIEDLFLCTTDLSEKAEGYYVDIFSIEISEGEFLEASLQGIEEAEDCTDVSAEITLVDSNGGDVGENSAGNKESDCPHIVSLPPEGTYYIIVYGSHPQQAPHAYGLSVDIGVPVCGDGTTEGLEECDDGNMVSGDGCSDSCVIEDPSCTVEMDLSDTVNESTLTAGDSSVGEDEHSPSCSSLGSTDVTYSFTAASDGPVVVSTDHEGTEYDTVLYVREDCIDPATEIACNDDIDSKKSSASSELYFDAVAGESYSIIVDGWGGDAGLFELSLTAPVCGNGELELGEDCDDGNTAMGDGCEEDCTITPVCTVGTADEDAGTLSPGGSLQVSLDVGSVTTFGGLSCSGPASGNASVSFTVEQPGLVDITYSFDAPTDVQVQLFADNKACDPMADCSDSHPETEATFSASLEPGDYLLAIETWEAGTEGEVQITIASP